MNEFRKLINLMESKAPLLEGRYWDNKGTHQKQAEQLSDLVPSSGPADTLKGEIFRAASKIYYDYYNNGFGNVWPEVATFLMHHVSLTPEITEMLHMHAMGNLGDDIDHLLEEMMTLVIEKIYEMDDTPNTTDMWDTPYTKNAFEPNLEDEGDEWEDEDEDDDWD